jgi:hypothetical protein
MQTVWTVDVELAAVENMERCAEMARCKSQISRWKDKLKQLQAEHRVHAQYAELRRNPGHWNRLKKNVKFKPEYVKIALSACRRQLQREDQHGMMVVAPVPVPALLKDWKQVPNSIRSDPELFLLRLENDPPVDYFPIELAGHRTVIEQVILAQRVDLLLNATIAAASSSSSHPLWSDRHYYRLFILHNDVTDHAKSANTFFKRFHFDVRNDADLILSLFPPTSSSSSSMMMTDDDHSDASDNKSSHPDHHDNPNHHNNNNHNNNNNNKEEDFWQRLLHPRSGCFDDRTPNREKSS